MTYADRIRAIDTRNLTSREVAQLAGCDTSTASKYLKYLGKEWRKVTSNGHAPFRWQPEPAPPVMDAEAEWTRILAGREYDSHHIRRAVCRIPGPELNHTAGGTSAGTCADAGDSYRRVGQERTRNEIRAGVRRLFEAGHTYGAIAEQLGLTRHQVSGICYRMGLLRGNAKMAAVAAARRMGGE